MKSTLAYLSHFLYWVWFVFYLFYTIEEITKLKRIFVGEGRFFMVVSTFLLFFAGLILFLFTITYKIPNTLNKYFQSAALIVAAMLLIFFFITLKGNSALIVHY
ncbi:hypothetical protein [Flavobacterium chilense]|uniref:Uncharacterized protein n=1 Tax=Flavobacterium chilense TaxID=946677 RepID=A0A1M6XJ98_9FLAO|nr:hypothetical protein [Flavobacterium chilense]SHL06037.1 hypothetical protein SAMN05444484_101160 [Flavobacterium chilense]